MNKINNNGYEYVDLGLPSGTLWATQNVGAINPSDYGLYFQWGDTQGYTKDQVGIANGKKAFTWKDYKWNPSGNGVTFTKYNAKNSALELEDDAAHINMGGDWHMPTPTQIQELLDNTTTAWTMLDGVSGMAFTSKKDESNSIFIPAVGCAWSGSIHRSVKYGFIWSSMVGRNYNDGSHYLHFNIEEAYLSIGPRFDGFTVRGVIDSECNDSKGKKDDKNSKGKKNESNKIPTFAEMLENELKKNLKVKIKSDYGGFVAVDLVYNGKVIDSDDCQVTTDFNPLDV